MERVLFVCVHNAGRSVMAEAFLRAKALDRAESMSAGTEPSSRPHDQVIHAMAEVGIDISHHQGRLLTDEMIRWATRVITMGCNVDADACPAIRYEIVEDWGLDDPAAASPAEVRRIRDEIEQRVEKLLASL